VSYSSWSSLQKRLKCPGIHYFEFLKEQESKCFTKYSNGIGDIRQELQMSIRSTPTSSNFARNANGSFNYHHLDIPPEFPLENFIPDAYNSNVKLSNFVASVRSPKIEKIDSHFIDVNNT